MCCTSAGVVQSIHCQCRDPGLALAALNLLMLLCTDVSKLDVGVSSLGGNVAQSQLCKGILPACSHMIVAAEITRLFSGVLNWYWSHWIIQAFFSPQPTSKQECRLYRGAYRKAWRCFLKEWYKKRKISSFMMCPCVKPLWRSQTQGSAQHLWSHRQMRAHHWTYWISLWLPTCCRNLERSCSSLLGIRLVTC